MLQHMQRHAELEDHPGLLFARLVDDIFKFHTRGLVLVYEHEVKADNWLLDS